MAYYPMGDRVFVRPHDEEKTSKGGIVMPATAKKNLLVGEVLATGVEVEVVKPGDRVMWARPVSFDAARPEIDDVPEINGVHILREHQVMSLDGPEGPERCKAAYARGVRLGEKGPQ